MIALARADDRLIHGLVAVAWTSSVAPETILVANDAAAADSFKKETMRLAKPAGVKLFIKSVESSAKALNNPINDGKRILLITASVEDAERVYSLLDEGCKFTALDIGTAGIVKKEGETYKLVIPGVYVSKEEYEAAKRLAQRGVDVFCQANPALEKASLSDIGKALEK